MESLSWKLTLFSIAFALQADNRVVCLNKTNVNATNSVDNTTEVVNVVDLEQGREAVLGMSSICLLFSLSTLRRCNRADVNGVTDKFSNFFWWDACLK